DAPEAMPTAQEASALMDSSRGDAVLEERALERDLARAEREHVAAIDLDTAAVARRTREHPLRQAAIARYEVVRGAEPRVGERGEGARELTPIHPRDGLARHRILRYALDRPDRGADGPREGLSPLSLEDANTT